METTYQSWIDKGYEIFAQEGPQGIRVQKLAKAMGTSKSSFYHHFGDQESFIEMLLDEHQDRAEQYAAEVHRCETLVPGFVNLIIKYKIVILFQRHLRRHREKLDFQLVYQQAGDVVNREILGVWAQFMGIQSDMQLAKSLYTVIEDLFYERLSEELLTYDWVAGLIYEIKSIVQGLITRKFARLRQ